MTYTVGPKGQVVVAKEIRERLGIRPGWLAVQMIVGDHVELRFIQPSSSASLKGSLARHTKIRLGSAPAEWNQARARAWRRASRRKVSG